jgi:peptidoglycan/LPS O-acetylase OafA/YrhL
VAIGLVLLWHGFLVINVPNHPFLERVIALGRLTWSGVDLFFVLSGFLIGGILLDAVDSKRYFSAFYIRRAHRILPLYAIVVGVLMLARWSPHSWTSWVTNPVPWWYYGCFLQNFWMAKNNTFGSNVLAVTWSLAVEEQFYLTLPVTIRFISRARLWWVVGGMIAGAPLLRMLVNPSFQQGLCASYVLLPCRADALGFGVAAALITRTEKVWGPGLRWKSYLPVAFGVVFLAVAALLLSGFNAFTNKIYGLEYSLLALLYFFLLLSVLSNRRFEAIFSLRVLRFLGIIAYGLYLLHVAFLLGIRTLALRVHPGQSGWVSLAASVIGIALAIVTAAVSWEYLEKPLIRRGHRYEYD